jgi:uncharacterized protein
MRASPWYRSAASTGLYRILRNAGTPGSASILCRQVLASSAWFATRCPSSPCLSSRFPYGTTITLDGLGKVAGAERALHELGFRECRVRYHDPVARIEVPTADIARLVQPDVRNIILGKLRDLGFLYVTLDLQGYRTGSLNEGLADRAATPPSGDRPLS